MPLFLDTPNLDAALAEIEKLKRAQDILEEVWNWTGPYGPDETIPSELMTALHAHFEFDDSE